MAIGDAYALLEELKARLDIPADDTDHDDELQDRLDGASREVEQFCDRQFNDAGSASARVYLPSSLWEVEVDDFHTTDGLVIKTGIDGTFGTTWTSADYQLEPLNGVVAGVDGWPYNRIVAVGGLTFPICGRRSTVEVTARWGWAEVPQPVKDATLILAAESFKLREAPFGVAGFGEFGVVRVQSNPVAMRKLRPYMKDPIKVG